MGKTALVVDDSPTMRQMVASSATGSVPAARQPRSVGVPECGPKPSMGRIRSAMVRLTLITDQRSIMAAARSVEPTPLAKAPRAP